MPSEKHLKLQILAGKYFKKNGYKVNFEVYLSKLTEKPIYNSKKENRHYWRDYVKNFQYSDYKGVRIGQKHYYPCIVFDLVIEKDSKLYGVNVETSYNLNKSKVLLHKPNCFENSYIVFPLFNNDNKTIYDMGTNWKNFSHENISNVILIADERF